MWEFLSWLFFIVFIAALVVAGAWLLKGYLATGSATGALGGGFFGPKPEKRLDVVEQANVDGRRRLILIRRDEVEHLIMTGGPVDVLIETGIGQSQKREQVAGEGAAPVVARSIRTIGQAAGDK